MNNPRRDELHTILLGLAPRTARPLVHVEAAEVAFFLAVALIKRMPACAPSIQANSQRRNASPVEDRSRKNSLARSTSVDPSISILAPPSETSRRTQLRCHVPSTPTRLTWRLCSS